MLSQMFKIPRSLKSEGTRYVNRFFFATNVWQPIHIALMKKDYCLFESILKENPSFVNVAGKDVRQTFKIYYLEL